MGNNVGVDPVVIKGVMAKAKTVLTTTQFKYFSMFYAEDISVADISVMCSVSRSSVYGVIKRARKCMKVNWR